MAFTDIQAVFDKLTALRAELAGIAEYSGWDVNNIVTGYSFKKRFECDMAAAIEYLDGALFEIKEAWLDDN